MLIVLRKYTAPSMPKKAAPKARRARAVRHREDGAATRARIVKASLKLIRKRGFDATTMRAIAEAAEVSLGLAYHYFPSKEAIVLSYYEMLQTGFARRVEQDMPKIKSLAARVQAVLEFRMEELARDRELFIALSRVALDPTNPLAVFSDETSKVREEAIATMRIVVDHPDVPAELRDAAASALWAFTMTLVIAVLFDKSKDQARARMLAALVGQALPMLISSVSGEDAAPMRAMITGALAVTGLLPAPR